MFSKCVDQWLTTLPCLHHRDIQVFNSLFNDNFNCLTLLWGMIFRLYFSNRYEICRLNWDFVIPDPFWDQSMRTYGVFTKPILRHRILRCTHSVTYISFYSIHSEMSNFLDIRSLISNLAQCDPCNYCSSIYVFHPLGNSSPVTMCKCNFYYLYIRWLASIDQCRWL